MKHFWEYPITTHYGEVDDVHSKPHNGIDFGLPMGTPVEAVSDGTVHVQDDGSGNFGKHVDLTIAPGKMVLYGHLSQFEVTDGEHVHSGQILGLSGSTGFSTGPHLHFGAYINGQVVDPSPYAHFLNGTGGDGMSGSDVITYSFILPLLLVVAMVQAVKHVRNFTSHIKFGGGGGGGGGGLMGANGGASSIARGIKKGATKLGGAATNLADKGLAKGIDTLRNKMDKDGKLQKGESQNGNGSGGKFMGSRAAGQLLGMAKDIKNEKGAEIGHRAKAGAFGVAEKAAGLLPGSMNDGSLKEKIGNKRQMHTDLAAKEANSREQRYQDRKDLQGKEIDLANSKDQTNIAQGKFAQAQDDYQNAIEQSGEYQNMSRAQSELESMLSSGHATPDQINAKKQEVDAATQKFEAFTSQNPDIQGKKMAMNSAKASVDQARRKQQSLQGDVSNYNLRQRMAPKNLAEQKQATRDAYSPPKTASSGGTGNNSTNGTNNVPTVPRTPNK